MVRIPDNYQPPAGGDSPKAEEKKTFQAAILTPSQRAAVLIDLPKDWEFDKDSLQGPPIAYSSKDRSSAVIVLPLTPRSGSNVLRAIPSAIEESGGTLTASEFQHVTIADSDQAETLIIRAKLGERDYFERCLVISFPESDMQVKFVSCPATNKSEETLEQIFRSISIRKS